ncbi:hypothetical protein ACJX0J_016801, partial [Zea mays]
VVSSPSAAGEIWILKDIHVHVSCSMLAHRFWHKIEKRKRLRIQNMKICTGYMEGLHLDRVVKHAATAYRSVWNSCTCVYSLEVNL